MGVLTCAVLFILPSPARAQWAAPIGIPTPAFGLSETAPAAPSPWVAATAGFYYVDAEARGATDDGNPYGTPAKPRQTIPTVLPAGSVVQLNGVYDTYHGSPHTIVSKGTATRPVFIRGDSPSSRPTVRNYWELTGSYTILENLEFAALDESQVGELTMLAPANHLALRNSDLHGNLTGGGLGIESWVDGATISNIVISGNTVHDNGDVKADYDQDVHGIHVGVRASSIWVVDNEMARNSGDGIQINAGSAADQATTNHIYVGRNYSHDNKQSGFWSKQAVDVIFSQNEAANHRPGNSSMGMCMGYQYAADQVWFLFNRVHDCDFGIGLASDSDLGTGTETYLIGNVIYNIHHSTADFQVNSGWGNAAIMLAGGIHRYVINNTIYDVDAGVNSPSPFGTLEIADNIISNVTAPGGNHIFIEMGSLADATNVHHDLLSGDPRLRWGGGAQTHPTATQLAGVQSIVFDPMFADPLQANFHIPTNSPAAGTGELNPVYDVFLRRYGFSITVDADGRSRAGSATTDMGAYLAGDLSAQPSEGVPSPSTPEEPSPQSCQGASAVPGAPTGLNIARQPDGTVAIAWSAPQSCGVPTSYVVEVGTAPKLANVESQATDSAETSVVWPLLPGTYYVRVRGRNAAGTGQPSNVVQAGGVPGAPIDFNGQIEGTTFMVSWTAPKAGGAPATYLLEAGSAPGRTDVGSMIVGASSTGVTSPVTRRGTFYLRVRAVSPVGSSAPSNEIRLTAR